jgi:hypothetical protein
LLLWSYWSWRGHLISGFVCILRANINAATANSHAHGCRCVDGVVWHSCPIDFWVDLQIHGNLLRRLCRWIAVLVHGRQIMMKLSSCYATRWPFTPPAFTPCLDGNS